MRFVDEVKLEIVAGDGGDGMVAFRRERRNPRGGPCGGNGGKGGDVVFRADRNLGTLLDLRSQPRIRAKRGQDGRGSDCHGRSAPPHLVRVPVGTMIFDDDTGGVLGDLVADGQEVVAAEGGCGGRGNLHFVTPSNRAPRRAEPGEKGVRRSIHLELKLLADVGIVGLPNVGKSTLIASLSAARPKIADYPFTTLVPNLGVVEVGPGATFVMADIPGLIRGASEGAGMGARFLRHIQRTALLVYMVAPDNEGEIDLTADLKVLLREVAAFDKRLAERPHLVVLNKADLPSARAAEPALRQALAQRGQTLTVISAATRQGLDALKQKLAERVQEQKAVAAPQPSAPAAPLPKSDL